METYKTIDEYISLIPLEVRSSLEKIREVIHEAAPDATEAISYGMPTFKLNGNLVHFAAFKDHIGFYPVPSGVNRFKELESYVTGKGTIRFPLNQPIPYDLIDKVVRFRAQENLRK